MSQQASDHGKAFCNCNDRRPKLLRVDLLTVLVETNLSNVLQQLTAAARGSVPVSGLAEARPVTEGQDEQNGATATRIPSIPTGDVHIFDNGRQPGEADTREQLRVDLASISRLVAASRFQTPFVLLLTLLFLWQHLRGMLLAIVQACESI